MPSSQMVLLRVVFGLNGQKLHVVRPWDGPGQKWPKWVIFRSKWSFLVIFGLAWPDLGQGHCFWSGLYEIFISF